MKNLTIKEAAEKMHCCAAHARKTLVKLDRENPGMGVVVRLTGNPNGRIEINPIAFALIMNKSTSAQLEELSGRVGMIEADFATFRARVGYTEKRLNRLEKGCERTVHAVI